MPLHPAFRAYLDDLNPLVEQAARDGFEPTPESARAALAVLNDFALPLVPVVRVFDSVMPVDPAGPVDPPVSVRVYVPEPDRASDVILFVHGGGHMAGDLDVYDFSARRTAAATKMVTVSVDYRRSPEAKFPAGLTDTYQVLTHLPDVLGDVLITGQVHAVADSGGAAKVASIAMRSVAGEWSNPIRRQVLLYPSLDYTLSGATVDRLGKGYFLTSERVAWYFDNYFPDGVDRTAASPLFGPFDANMPETLVIAAEFDPLLSEACEYVERMQAAGGDAHLIIAPGMIHAFMFFETLVPAEIARTYEIISGFLSDGAVPHKW